MAITITITILVAVVVSLWAAREIDTLRTSYADLAENYTEARSQNESLRNTLHDARIRIDWLEADSTESPRAKTVK